MSLTTKKKDNVSYDTTTHHSNWLIITTTTSEFSRFINSFVIIRITLSVCKSIETIVYLVFCIVMIQSVHMDKHSFICEYKKSIWILLLFIIELIILTFSEIIEWTFYTILRTSWSIVLLLDIVLFRSARFFSSSIKKKAPTNNNDDDICISHSSNHLCPICRCPYDNQKHKRLIDTTCHHEKCYTCMFKYEQCSICLSHLGKYIYTYMHTCICQKCFKRKN